jgi:hypothetical protein
MSTIYLDFLEKKRETLNSYWCWKKLRHSFPLETADDRMMYYLMLTIIKFEEMIITYCIHKFKVHLRHTRCKDPIYLLEKICCVNIKI